MWSPPAAEERAQRVEKGNPLPLDRQWGALTCHAAFFPYALRALEGSTENATIAAALLADLVERGLDPEQGILFVIDGAKALRRAIRNVFGEAPVQRCVRNTERSVIDHLPERERSAIKRRAWALDSFVCWPASPELDRSSPVRPARCAKGWKRRSRSPGSASPAR